MDEDTKRMFVRIYTWIICACSIFMVTSGYFYAKFLIIFCYTHNVAYGILTIIFGVSILSFVFVRENSISRKRTLTKL